MLLAAGLMLLLASFLPWLRDSWGSDLTAWQIPLDLGWQIHTSFLNYGVLSVGCALYMSLISLAHWFPFRGKRYFVGRQGLAGGLCLLVIGLFCLQLLCCDFTLLSRLTGHMRQVLLLEQHFGYSVGPMRLPLDPLEMDLVTWQQRLALLLDLVSVGPFFPALGGLFLLASKDYNLLAEHRPYNWRIALPLLLCLVFICGRGPLGLGCQGLAQGLIAIGNYNEALRVDNLALAVNPGLDLSQAFHRDRGQAWYYLHPDQPTVESREYLAWIYEQKGIYQDAYQGLQNLGNSTKLPTWAVQSRSNLLMHYADSAATDLLQGRSIDSSSMFWLQMLVKQDPQNLYGNYMLGRVQYAVHNYDGARQHLTKVIQLTSDADVQSSAYTYIALIETQQGHYQNSRVLLAKAVSLDRHYYNNTAREALSGLR